MNEQRAGILIFLSRMAATPSTAIIMYIIQKSNASLWIWKLEKKSCGGIFSKLQPERSKQIWLGERRNPQFHEPLLARCRALGASAGENSRGEHFCVTNIFLDIRFCECQ
jgi:hypothetical protein